MIYRNALIENGQTPVDIRVDFQGVHDIRLVVADQDVVHGNLLPVDALSIAETVLRW